MVEILKTLLEGNYLTREQVQTALSSFFEGGATDAQIGAFLFGMGGRLPSAAELLGGGSTLRKFMTRLPLSPELGGARLLDTCGTGGSGHQSFNTSTVVGFISAAAGCRVVKHGNRASTSACGSADLLELLGIRIDLSPEAAAECLARTNFCFCFAPFYHAATKRVQLIRKELPFRTLFNFLGPLANPAEVKFQLLGVSSAPLVSEMAKTLLSLGAERALVVSGEDGLDEITLSGKTRAAEVRDGVVSERTFSPGDFGLEEYPRAALLGGSKELNLEIARDILAGGESPHFDLVLANAAASLYVEGRAGSIRDGVEMSREMLKSGAAAAKVEEIAKISASL